MYSIFYVFPCLLEIGSIIAKNGSIGRFPRNIKKSGKRRNIKRLRIGDDMHFDLHLIVHLQLHNNDHF